MAAPPLPRLVVADGGLPGWLVLGERPNREIAFGAVGKFWQSVIEWRDVPRAEFNGFAEPGWGKIAANFSVLPYGERSTHDIPPTSQVRKLAARVGARGHVTLLTSR